MSGFKTGVAETKEMAQWLRALTVLAKDEVPSTQTALYNDL